MIIVFILTTIFQFYICKKNINSKLCLILPYGSLIISSLFLTSYIVTFILDFIFSKIKPDDTNKFLLILNSKTAILYELLAIIIICLPTIVYWIILKYFKKQE